MKTLTSKLLASAWKSGCLWNRLWCAAVLIQALTIGAAFAAPGDLDPSFGGSGKVTTAFGGRATATSFAVQSDGKIVVTGRAWNGSDNDLALSRYHANGTLDESFGTAGKVMTPVGTSNNEGYGVLVLGDGKILVAGAAQAEPGSNWDVTLVRYADDGTLDASFGTAGKVVTPISASDDGGLSMAAQGDGRIIVAGYAWNGTSSDFLILRYLDDGTLDSTFGTGGKVMTDFSGGGDYGRKVVLLGDGRILVAGTASNGSDADFAAARYLADGTLDPTFGVGGKALADFDSSPDGCLGMAVQGDGKIVLAGYSSDSLGFARIALLRFQIDGTLDTGFGTDGKILLAAGPEYDAAVGVAIQSDGKIVVAGASSNLTNFDFLVLRFTSAGALDSSFGTAGKVRTDFNGNDNPNFMALQSDGRILVAGDTVAGNNSNFALARYVVEARPIVTTDSPISVTPTSVTLRGTVNPNGQPSTAQFEFGPTTSYGYLAGVTLSPNNGTSPQNVTAYFYGLTPGTTYHYRLTAQNINGLATGMDVSFTTPLHPEIRVFAGPDANAIELVSAQPAAVGFGSTPLGTPITQSFTIKNGGPGDLLLSSLNLPSGFEVVGGPFTPVTLAPNATHTLQVRFLANETKGFYSGNLMLASNDQDEPTFYIPISATATLPLNPATLDASFASTGKIRTPIGTLGDYGQSVAVIGNRIYVAGYTVSAGTGPDFALLCFREDGTPETTFGTNGRVITPIGTSADFGTSVTVDLQGRILVAGYATVAGNNDFALARYLPTGELDTTFGTGGKVTTPIANNDQAYDVAVQTDGKILVAGSTQGANSDFAVVRYLENGTVDSSFGINGNGRVITPIGPGNDNAQSLALQADGKIVVAGHAVVSGSTNFAVVRYLETGALDPNFGTGGKVNTDFAGGFTDQAFGVLVQFDQRIVVAGFRNGGIGGNDFALARYLENGTLDPDFGSEGKVTTDLGGGTDQGYSVAQLWDGRLVVGGTSFGGTNIDFGVACYLANGALDPTFGNGGKVHTDFGNGNDFGYSVAVQPNQRIVVAGWSSNGSNDDVALVRYSGDLVPGITTLAASGVTQTAATLNGSVNPRGVITWAWFEYGLTTSYGNGTSMQSAGYGTTATPLSAALTELTPNTTYHYRIGAHNGETVVYGADQTFFTAGDVEGPTGGTMTLSTHKLDAGGTLTVSFADWVDANGPLQYSVFVNSILVSPMGTSASRSFVIPTAGVYSITGRIHDALGNNSGVIDGLLVMTPQESWRESHFGTHLNYGLAADTADPDGDGNDNATEFVAGLLPNDPASRIVVRVQAVAGQPGQRAVVFSPRLADRSYVLKSKSSLTDATWSPVFDVTTEDNGTERTITHLSAGGARFYTIEITK
jgi:uncharacterized delta-60 repeat protein